MAAAISSLMAQIYTLKREIDPSPARVRRLCHRASSATSAVIITFHRDRRRRHVLGPVSQFPSFARCGVVIDATENTAQQNDESKRNLLGTTYHRHYRPQQQQRGRFQTIATRNDPSFSPRRSREGGKKVLTSVKKREEGGKSGSRGGERTTDRLNCPNGDKRNFKGR